MGLVGLLLTGAAAAHAQVMTLPGALEVSETGAAVYTVPIEVPPGTAGMQPALELQYNSQGGNGLLGVGWSLSGLPSIGRCPRTMAQDGVGGGINFDADDRFCLDGQRLVAISGTYGADGTEYRLEREGFSKIVSYGTAGTGPAWFKVWTKAGQVMEFGNTADSRIEAQGKTTARLWAVNKVSDTAGNYLTVSYAEDSTNGEYRPDRIDYTGNAGAGTSPYASVQFVYEIRPASDIVPLYQGGSLIKTTKRLVNINTYVGGDFIQSHVIDYELSASTGASRIAELSRCRDMDGTACLPATSLEWDDDNSSAFETAIGWSTSATYTGWNAGQGDFNGDGRTDLLMYKADASAWGTRVALSIGNGTFAAPISWSVLGNYSGWNPAWGDFNGDGQTDMAMRRVGTSGWQAHAALSVGNGSFTAPVSFLLPGNQSSWVTSVGDFNGDGRTDIQMYLTNASYWSSYVAFANGDGSFATPIGWSVSGNYSGWNPAWGDFNGDGRTDMVMQSLGTSGWQARAVLSVGDGSFTAPVSFLLSGNQSSWVNSVGDFNGDGRDDIQMFLANASYWGSYVAFAKGDGSFATPIGWSVSGNYSGWNPAWGDFNGDGRTDMVMQSLGTSGWQARAVLSKGDGSFTAPVSFLLSGNQSSWVNSVGDFNGDGRDDIQMYLTNASYWSSYVAHSPMRVWGITRIENGIGASTELEYSPLSALGAPYIADDNASYPLVDIQAPLYVVSQVSADDGTGGTYQSTYRYAGAKADVSGRGFLGFRTMTVKDEETGIEQVTTYRQDWPFVGQISGRTKLLGAVELNRVDNAYAATDLGGIRRFVHLTQSVEVSRELTGTALPTVTTTYQYDAYGNTTEVVTSTPDGYAKTTANTYTNDISNWLLGRLTRAEVTSTTPN